MPEKSSAKNQSVSQLLKNARTDKKLSLAEVEVATKIRGKYLRAIEAGRFGELPHDVYGRGFVQSYAEFLGLDAAGIGQKYVAERGDLFSATHRRQPLAVPKTTLSPRLATLLGSIAIIVGIGAYIVWQFSGLVAPPKLDVSNPPGDQVVTGSLINIKGRVDGGADVFVNDSPVLTDANGNFNDPIALQDGVNSIRITAKSKLGKTALVTRNILAHVPTLDPTNRPPAAPFNGIAASIQVKDVTAAVTVLVDGRQVFRGTMLPGTTQDFKGNNSVIVSTSNAGATSLTITNSVVAGKLLSPLGNNGQTKNNLEFDKDTQFQ